MIIEFDDRETRALAVIAELCERDRRWLAHVLPEPTDQLAVTTAIAKLYGDPVLHEEARLQGNRGRHHRSFAELRNRGLAG